MTETTQHPILVAALLGTILPAGAQDAGTQIAVCIAGDTPIYWQLESALIGKTNGSRSFALQRVFDAERTAGCHILFFGLEEANRRP